jgi:hypothetical protein
MDGLSTLIQTSSFSCPEWSFQQIKGAKSNNNKTSEWGTDWLAAGPGIGKDENHRETSRELGVQGGTEPKYTGSLTFQGQKQVELPDKLS